MTRLLFAAARGARIEKTNTDGEFRSTCAVPLWDMDESAYSWRIHPDDAHLQYGPISSALRDAAVTGAFPYTVAGLMAETAVRYEREYGVVFADDYIMFLLLLAEALADTGL